MQISKIEPYTPEWELLANRLARSFVHGIYPCKHCGYPVIPGYCCGTCGSSDPANLGVDYADTI